MDVQIKDLLIQICINDEQRALGRPNDRAEVAVEVVLFTGFIYTPDFSSFCPRIGLPAAMTKLGYGV